MSLDFIIEMYIPVVLVVCLCVGYVIKNFLPTDDKWIPLIMLILGAVLGCIANQTVDVATIAAGMVTGLASTGLHQVFKQLIEHKEKVQIQDFVDDLIFIDEEDLEVEEEEEEGKEDE